MYEFLSGAVMISCWVVALFFLRFWRQTKDSLFLVFAVAFLILGIERILPAWLNIHDEPRTFIYLIRLVAFGLILAGIINKNSESTKLEENNDQCREL